MLPARDLAPVNQVLQNKHMVTGAKAVPKLSLPVQPTRFVIGTTVVYAVHQQLEKL